MSERPPQETPTVEKEPEAPVEETPKRRTLSAGDFVPSLITTLAAVVLALAVGAVLIAFSNERAVKSLNYFWSYPWDFFNYAGTAIWDSYKAMFVGALGSTGGLATTMEVAAPLICGGLGVTLAFRAGMFNIGGKGQLLMGAAASAYVGFHFSMPPGIHMLVALLAGIAGGAIWGGIAGILKARAGAHEVITTIMLNYVASGVLLWFLQMDAFQRPGSDNPQSPPVHDSATYPAVDNLHAGILLSLLGAVLVWWLLNRSKLGFELRAVGANPEASRTAGMNVAKVFTLGMVMAGAFGGLAGTMFMLGTHDSLSPTFSGSVGFDSITVALLGRATPAGTVLAGILFGILNVGGRAMQVSPAGTPLELASVIQALIVLFVAAPALVQGMLRMKKRAGGTGTDMAKGWGA